MLQHLPFGQCPGLEQSQMQHQVAEFPTQSLGSWRWGNVVHLDFCSHRQ